MDIYFTALGTFRAHQWDWFVKDNHTNQSKNETI